MIKLLSLQLQGDAERVRRSTFEAIGELQGLPAAATQIVNDVQLPDSVVVLVPHKLGRRPGIALVSPPRGAALAGIIVEITDIAAGNPDRAKFVAFKASGMGATVVVDVEIK